MKKPVIEKKIKLTIKNGQIIFERASKFEEDIQEGKRCKSCHEVIRDETKWYKGPILCQGCQDAVEYGMAWH
jgi:formylmethanofuran dehydrogenase subunit E